MSQSTSGRFGRRRVVAAISIVGSALVVAASASSTAIAAGSGVIKLGVTTAVNNAAYNQPAVPGAAEAAAYAINNQGGIDGRKVQIIFCNDNASPNGDEACARQFVSDHVVAVVGSGPFFGANFFPVTAAAKIPSVGSYGVDNVGLTNVDGGTYVWPIGAQEPMEFAAFGESEKLAGSKKLAEERVDVPQTVAQSGIITQYAKDFGFKVTTEVAIPAGAPDVSSYAAQIQISGADSVALDSDPTTAIRLMTALNQLGLTKLHYTILSAAVPTTATALQLAAQSSSVTVVSPVLPTTDTTNPLIKEYNADEKAANKAGIANTSAADAIQATGVEAWEGVEAIKLIAPQLHGVLTSKSLIKFLRNPNSTVNLFGIPWYPGRIGPASEPRVTQSGVYFDKITKSGQLALLSATPVDMYAKLGIKLHS
jgi:ABC-type branched-subunit amino acid transport system substrate-binding protein